MNVITRWLIYGRMLTQSCLISWWRLFLRMIKVSTLYIWCLTLVPVVLKNRFVSCLVCVVWWQNRRKREQKVGRLLKTRFCRTLKKGFLCWSTLSLLTVLVKVWRIRLWRLPMPVIWLVVWLTYRMMWLLQKKTAVHSVDWFVQTLKITMKLLQLCTNVS